MSAQQTPAHASASRPRQSARRGRRQQVCSKVEVPAALGGGWIWIRRLLSLLNGGASVSKDRLLRSKQASSFASSVGDTRAADATTVISHFDFVVVVYEIGEEGKKRTHRWYIAQIIRVYKVYDRGGKPTKYMHPVVLGEEGVHLRVKLMTEAPSKVVGSSHTDPLCFHLKGLESEEHDAIGIGTVLAKASFASVEEYGGELRYYISQEDHKFFTELTADISSSVVNNDDVEADREPQPADRKRRGEAVAKKQEARRVREEILSKEAKSRIDAGTENGTRVQRSGRVSKRPVDVYSALHCG